MELLPNQQKETRCGAPKRFPMSSFTNESSNTPQYTHIYHFFINHSRSDTTNATNNSKHHQRMSIDPRSLDNTTLNQQSSTEQFSEVKTTLKTYLDSDPSQQQRLSLPPVVRISLFTVSGLLLGGMGGMMVGYKKAGLKYLASNSHRMPTSFNGWYFYHKRKSYYCVNESMKLGFRTGVKISVFVAGMFSAEAGLDYLRGKVDFANTMMATCLSGFFYAWFHKLNKVQSKDLIKRGGKVGIFFGLGQDLLQFVKGADVWYLSKLFGVEPMRLKDRVLRDSVNKLH